MPELGAHFVLACDHSDIKDGKMKLFLPGQGMKWWIPARGYGARGPGFKWFGGDTPPGRYRFGQIHYIPPDDFQARAFGPFFVDMIELEEQERTWGRAGIGFHGGGSSLANAYSAARQGWSVTHGCVRAQNEDVRKVVNTILWMRKRSGFRSPGASGRNLFTYDAREDYVDFTVEWVDEL